MVIGWEMQYPMKAAFIQRTVLVGFSLAWLVVVPPAGAANPLIPATQAEAPAGKPIELPKDLTQEQVRDLMSRLSDTDVRQMLIAELDTQTQQETEESAAFAAGRFFQRFQDEGERIRSVAAKMAAAIPDLPAAPSLIWAGVTAGGTVSGWRIIAEIVIFLLVGVLAEWAYRRASALAGLQRARSTPETLASRLGLLGLQALIDLFGIIVFALVAISLMYMSGSRISAQPLLFMTIIWGVIGLRLVSLVSRFIFAPKISWLRAVPLSDQAARAIHARVLLLATAIVIARRIGLYLSDIGLDFGLLYLFIGAAWVTVVLMIVGVIWQARALVAAFLRGATPSNGGARSLSQSLASNWHVLASAYVIVLFFAAVLIAFGTTRDPVAALVISWLLPAIVPLADLGLRRLVAGMFGSRGKPEEGAGEEVTAAAPAGTAAEAGDSAVGQLAQAGDEGSYQSIALRNLRILLGVGVGIAFVNLWGIDVQGFAEQLVGERVARALVDITIISLLAYAVWGFAKAAVERHVRDEALESAETSKGVVSAPGTTRLRTLLPLLRKFVFITLLAVVIMTALSSLGVNVGPLVAGAGMVGIAIGFGAQALVRDIVSGMFFLLDDAFRMGEYVEVGGAKGVVEKMSIRSLQLRHHNGPVHTIPFGEIKQLTNYSREYVIMKFELRLPFETDIDKVRKIIKKIGKDMLQDPELAPLMLGPLKSQGVMHIDDSALVIRCKFTAIPGQQFLVRRQAFTRIQKAFEENDIHFAPRRVIVEAVTPEQAVSAAASALDAESKKDGGKVDDRG